MPDGLHLASPWLLLAALLVAPAAYFALRQRRQRPTLRVTSTLSLHSLPRTWAVRAAWLPLAALLVAALFTALGLARPQARGAEQRDISVEGIDIVVALDVSTSMLAADFKPNNRISVAKDVLKSFLLSRTNDRLGLVAFASDAYTQCPLTLDQHVLLSILDSIRPGIIADGTAIGNAIATATNRLRESDAKSKVVLLITDGDNNAGQISPLEAAEAAAKLGVKVFTIMVGTGGRVPYPTGKDLFGNPTYELVDIDVNPELLKQIAAKTGGQFYIATDKASLEGSLQDVLSRLEKTKLYEAGAYVSYDELYPWLLWPAALLALIAAGLRATRLRSFP